MQVSHTSLVGGLKKALATNSTASSYTALIPTITRPVASSTRAVYDLGEGKGTRDQNVITVYPVGRNDNNETVSVKVTGWNFVRPTGTGRGLYVSSLVCQVAGTISTTLLGIANEDIIATEFFCDILSLTKGVATLYQGTSDLDIAYFKAPVQGFELVEVTCTIGTGDQANALVKFDNAVCTTPVGLG